MTLANGDIFFPLVLDWYIISKFFLVAQPSNMVVIWGQPLWLWIIALSLANFNDSPLFKGEI